MTAAAQPLAMPLLRQELRIEPGAPLVNGAPSWTLFDPVRHAFFQLGRIEFTIFSRWANGRMHEAAQGLVAEGLEADEADAEVTRVVEFSLANNLTIAPLSDSVGSFERIRSQSRKAWWRWLVDHYLFFRIPLVKPADFLERTLPRVAPLWSPRALGFFVVLAIVGLFLVSRQWDAFTASFLYFFSWQGLIAYAIGLSVVKIAHELGHAYTATRFGCRVPSMGASFLIMMPVLYTDTTGAWRLTSRRKRLAIDCAGVSAELMIASIATLAWALLPEGMLRSVAFILATTSWVMSLAINLNPFMRFDGYYLLSDLLGVPNLQPRGFALGRWRLRELLFRLGEPPPELLPRRMARILVVYAWATWIYRFILFLGIALLVYHLFFKLLGIILFVVEMAVFLVRPIWSEINEWRLRRGRILASPRGRLLVFGLGGLVLLGFLPLDRHVSAPAVMGPIAAVPIVAGDPARVERVLVRNGQRVAKGAPLIELIAPDIDVAAAQSRLRIAGIEAQLARGAADAEDLSERAVLERELLAEGNKLAGFDRRSARLVLRAPIAGVVTDLDTQAPRGRWLGGAEVLARVVTPNDYDVQSFVRESDISRIEDGALAHFVPDDPVLASRVAKLMEKSASAVQHMDQPILASTQGGPIAVNEDAGKTLRPREALYRLRFVATPGAGSLRPVRGSISIDAQSQSLFGQMLGSLVRTIRAEASMTSG
ncbi:HlyD family efflux transporter periplasmic adaptor subunit [Sphingopyxis sp.]|uniref:HlyD family efflux transporter periplasmic adaptor subunit n=1 Tax=Sphingopyxis sp. TaxID=1908224 RepID=UPI003D139771